MKLTHLIRVRVYSKEEDNEEEVLKSFLSLFPFDLEEEKLQTENTVAEGFENRKIRVFELILKRTKHTKEFLDQLLEKLTKEQKQTILDQAESRLDDKLNLFIRLDKSKLIKDNELKLTDSGDCFHIKISIAAFPAKREIAMEIVKKIFKT
ncbi:MAG: RNA-binding domain-containing protein [Candidatus Woesearchaeota archaeon]|jgi:hypothetical protein|nr:RNA-binding domain-containing protein [Candidatus Woesearchaeota archaeon]